MKFFSLYAIFAAFVGFTLAKVQYTGVNESSAEFGKGKYPGVYNTDYVYPSIKSIQTTAAQGMNVFRLGFAWERLQRQLNSEFNEEEFARLDEVVEAITKTGSVCILNPHNFARYNEQIVGSGQVPNSAFADLWKRFAQIYKNNNKVWFGLVNEPHDMPTAQWFSAARDAVDAIRAAGAQNTVLVPGNAYTGSWCWNSNGFYGELNGEVALRYFSSADKNVVFEVHQYFDSDYSGTHTECVQRPCNKLFTGFVEWLKANNLKGFIGELGAAVNDSCKQCVDEALQYLDNNSDVVVGWAWWAAGPWWGKYMYSIEPSGNKFPMQMTWLKPYLVGPSSLTSVPTYNFDDVSQYGAPYCEFCVVGGTGGDGSLWGWENEESCVVDYSRCKQPTATTTTRTTTTTKTTTTNAQSTSESCFSTNMGFPCCNSCNVVYTDNDGKWGVENNNWCGIPNNCQGSSSCWASALGYPCCTYTSEVVFTDNDGSWGVENNNWCGLN